MLKIAHLTATLLACAQADGQPGEIAAHQPAVAVRCRANAERSARGLVPLRANARPGAAGRRGAYAAECGRWS